MRPLKIIDLTPLDQEFYDPTGRIRTSLTHYAKQGRPTPTPPIFDKWSREEWLEQWLKRSDRRVLGPRHQVYDDYNKSLVPKYGPQGARFPLSQLQSQIKEYYTNAYRKPRSVTLQRGAAYLRRLVSQLAERVGIAQPIPRTVVSTNASIPTGRKKGTFAAETILMSEYRHAYPAVPGERDQRQKKRTIYQDSVCNVRYVEDSLNAVRHWLRTYLPEYFGSWLNPDVVVRPTATRIVDYNEWVVETDYRSMDTHYHRDLWINYCLPIYEILLPPGEYQRLAEMTVEMFSQELYFGNTLWTGLHNLFSGEPITNDGETIVSVCQELGARLELSLPVVGINTMHLGDDQATSFKKKEQAEDYFRCFKEESENAGMPLSVDKCMVRQAAVGYCRCQYYPAARRRNGIIIGAYPSILALNNMINPESGAETYAALLVSTYQRLDGCVGSPDFQELVQFIGRYSSIDTDISLDDVQLPPSWWDRLYGESWDPSQSASFKLLSRR